MDIVEKWKKKYSDLNKEFLSTKGMMTEREIYEVKSHLKSISSFIEDIEGLRQPPFISQLCPNCKSNETKKHYSGYKCFKCKSLFWA